MTGIPKLPHRVTRKLSDSRFGTQVTLTCSCGRWSAMTVAYATNTVARCTRSLLSGSDGVHTFSTLERSR